MIVVTYLTIVFGELIPKRIGMTAAEPVAKLVAGPMKVLSVVASPLSYGSFRRASRAFPICSGCAIPTVRNGGRDQVDRAGRRRGRAVQAVEQKIVGRVFSLG